MPPLHEHTETVALSTQSEMSHKHRVLICTFKLAEAYFLLIAQ